MTAICALVLSTNNMFEKRQRKNSNLCNIILNWNNKIHKRKLSFSENEGQDLSVCSTSLCLIKYCPK